MKKHFIYIAIILFVVVLSCSKDDNGGSNDGQCNNKVEYRNDSIIISGKCDFEPELTFTNGGYLLTISEKSDNVLTSFEVYQTAFSSYMGVKASSASGLATDGWYKQASIWEHLEGIWKWRVKATGEYRIVFAKLPLQVTSAEVPVTYNMKGQAVVGPIHLSDFVSFSISCPDAKLAGFTAELYNASTGDEILYMYKNALDMINLDEDNHQINNYSKNQSLSLAEGDYLVKVSANKNAEWNLVIEPSSDMAINHASK